jgi:hypothetical protein
MRNRLSDRMVVRSRNLRPRQTGIGLLRRLLTAELAERGTAQLGIIARAAPRVGAALLIRFFREFAMDRLLLAEAT